MSGKRLPARIKTKALSPQHIQRLKKYVRYDGPTDRAFFEKYVWWWRELETIYPRRERLFEIPERAKWKFFPKSLFQTLQYYAATGDIAGWLDGCLSEELSFRLEHEPDPFDSWPTFCRPFVEGKIYGEAWKVWHLRNHSFDIRHSDKTLVRDFAKALPSLRAEWHKEAKGGPSYISWKSKWELSPNWFRVEQNNYFLNSKTFRAVEMLDKKLFFGDTIDNDEMSYVRKTIRRYWYRTEEA